MPNELEGPMRAALEAVQAAVTRLLRDGEHDPQHLVLALARMTGELGAGIAQAGGLEAEEILGDLADLVHEAGQAHAEALPVAGRA